MSGLGPRSDLPWTPGSSTHSCDLGLAPALAEPWSPPLPHGGVHSPLLAALFGTSTVARREHCSWSSHHPMSPASGPAEPARGRPCRGDTLNLK